MSRESRVVDGVLCWDFSVHVRSKINPRVRAQRRRLGIPLSAEEAEDYERDLWQECFMEVARREHQGISWEELFEKWDHHYTVHPSKRWAESTRRDMYARLRQWSTPLFKKSAQTLVQADFEDCLKLAQMKGATFEVRKKLKRSFEAVFKWGIAQKFILGRDVSPIKDIDLDATAEERAEKVPLIMSRDEISLFLTKAKEIKHPWYPVWFFALYTGMRSGEINALRKDKLELVPEEVARALDNRSDGGPKSYGRIRVQLSFDTRLKRNGPTKARYWRTVPVNSRLYWFLVEHLKTADFGSDTDGQRVFERFADWDRSDQSQVVREFCKAQGLKEITFHTLRACFATQMLESGADMTSVMKIGGWKDIKTVMIYVRLAGVDEAGKTERLSFGGDPERPVYGNVVNMFGKGRL